MCEKTKLLSNESFNNLATKSLSDFSIEKKIGKGQFSTVYRAKLLTDEKIVALKKIQISNIPDEKSKVDCLKEINLLQQLNHLNIIKYLSSFIESSELYIVLELADGGDLAELVNHCKKRKYLISEKNVWNYFTQITFALQHMHSKRIMHRDIKPANVFLKSNGMIKLGDLGLGRFFSNKTLVAHSLVGTPYYMSPEQINECGYDFKSDIWSVGCLLFELATLQSPFCGDKMSLYTLCKKIKISDFPPIPCNLYSQQIRDLIVSCLRLDPLSRPDINYIYEISQKMNCSSQHFK